MNRAQLREFIDTELKLKDMDAPLQEEFYEVIFNTVDSDNSGTIEKEEVFDFFTKLTQGDFKELTERMA